MATQRVKADWLPESTRYRDTGCALHPKCLSCPRAVCILDEQVEKSEVLTVRGASVSEIMANGGSVHDIRAALGVSERSAYRYQQNVRRQGL